MRVMETLAITKISEGKTVSRNIVNVNLTCVHSNDDNVCLCTRCNYCKDFTYFP